MIERHPFASLGEAEHGGLHVKPHFSFAQYHDPKRLHWGALRSGTTTPSSRAPASRPTRMRTWKSSPVDAAG